MTDDANQPPPNNAGRNRRSVATQEPDGGATPLVSALDPRFELKSALESSRSAQLNRQMVLRAQLAQLEAELHASVETSDSCDEQITRLQASLEASRVLALGGAL